MHQMLIFLWIKSWIIAWNTIFCILLLHKRKQIVTLSTHNIGWQSRKLLVTRFCGFLYCLNFLGFHICYDVYVLINFDSSIYVLYYMIKYKQNTYEPLIMIGWSTCCVYIFEYQGLIENFVRSYFVLIPLFHICWK